MTVATKFVTAMEKIVAAAAKLMAAVSKLAQACVGNNPDLAAASKFVAKSRGLNNIIEYLTCD